jgi:thiamine biosynthesis lipoprotein
MGTWAHVVAVDGSPGALCQARARIEQLEARWSRFRPDSEVSRLNRAGGRPVLVSADTAALVGRAVAGWRGTGGRFDPMVLGPLLDAGYDRCFRGGRVVGLPAGAGFDPGGIGKGLAADLVVAELLAGGARGACVNLGGDLRAEGAGPWVVDVADPFDDGAPPIARLAVDAGGVATSSRLRRAWTGEDGTARHHVIDPTTGKPADTGVAAVTVVTGDAWRAEVLAKAALLAGLPDALHVLADGRATGLVVDDRGVAHHAPGLEPFLA